MIEKPTPGQVFMNVGMADFKPLGELKFPVRVETRTNEDVDRPLEAYNRLTNVQASWDGKLEPGALEELLKMFPPVSAPPTCRMEFRFQPKPLVGWRAQRRARRLARRVKQWDLKSRRRGEGGIRVVRSITHLVLEEVSIAPHPSNPNAFILSAGFGGIDTP